jgi:hypothetical protein
MQGAYEKGLVIQTKPGSVPQFKRYLDEQEGRPIDTIWTDITPINSQAKEAVGYPTQKPLPLLDRIIKCSSNDGDIVLDAFCGCGTTIEAAEMLSRQWIGVDFSPTACKIVSKRLQDKCKLKDDEALWENGRAFVTKNLPWTEDQLREISPMKFQDWAVIAINGTPNTHKSKDMGIDGKLYPASATQPGGIGASGRQLEFTEDLWYPVQVKQKEKVGRPDVDMFQTVMRRERTSKGVIIGFGFSRDALVEIKRANKATGTEMIPVTVGDILKMESRARTG